MVPVGALWPAAHRPASTCEQGDTGDGVCETVEHVDVDLTLRGLKIIHDLNSQ